MGGNHGGRGRKAREEAEVGMGEPGGNERCEHHIGRAPQAELVCLSGARAASRALSDPAYSPGTVRAQQRLAVC